MAEIVQTRSAGRRVVNDYFHTFARLIHPHSSSIADANVDEARDGRWPLGQTLAFATIASIGLWTLIALLIRNFA